MQYENLGCLIEIQEKNSSHLLKPLQAATLCYYYYVWYLKFGYCGNLGKCSKNCKLQVKLYTNCIKTKSIPIS